MTVLAELDLTDSSPRIAITSEFRHKENLKSLPGAKWSNKDRQWKLPAGWASCLALRTTFGDELVIGGNLAQWAAEEKRTRVDPAVALREVIDLKEHPELHAVPEVAQAMTLEDELKLFPHQASGAAFTAVAKQDLIADETGTGKSAQTITALRILHRQGHDVFPVLVVAPNTVKKTWERELDMWWPGLEVSVIKGGAAQRRKAFETPAHVYIINWELLRKHSRLAPYGNMSLKRCTECGGLDERITVNTCQVHVRELNQLVFRTVIADEVHRAKSPSAAATRALWYASKDATYRFGLTGTPVQDTIVDLWAIMRFIAPEEYSSKTRYIDRYADTGYNMWGAFEVYGVRDAMRHEFDAVLHPRMRRMLKKVVLPFLPPIVRQTRVIEMNAAQRKAYRQMKKDTLAELESGVLVGVNPLSRATRLLQFASAYAELETKKLEDGRVTQRVIVSEPSNKVDAFMDDLENGDFGDSSIVVFAQSRQLIELLSKRLTQKETKHGLITGSISTDDRQKHIDAFQAGETRFMLVTIDAGGVGLTLTAANVAVFLQRSWSSVAMRQAESRVHRIGSEKHDSIMIIDYVSEDTLEEWQISRLDGKYARIEDIVRDQDLLRKMLKDGSVDSGDVTDMDPIGADDPDVLMDPEEEDE